MKLLENCINRWNFFSNRRKRSNSLDCIWTK